MQRKNTRRKKTGLAPGTVIFTGNQKVEEVSIHHLKYNAKVLEEQVFKSHDITVLQPSDVAQVDWYDIRGIHDTEIIVNLGRTFDIHSLVQEAIVDIHQRPKFEEYQNGIFITLRALSFDPAKLKVSREHVAIYFYEGLITTFQETDSDLFESVRTRINQENARIRERGADYLAFALIDVIVDHYYVVLEEMEDIIEAAEEGIIDGTINSKSSIHLLKKELLILRKAIIPLREAMSQFSKTDSELVKDSSRVFIRDLYDHVIQVMDAVESHRDLLNGLQDLYISELSFKMNKVMQLLTLIATIFIPLTFLAGIYGMNFKYMPELDYKYGYFVLLGIMLVIFVGLLILFRKKKWL